MWRTRVMVTALATPIALIALSACGSGGGEDGGARVASLATPEAGSSAAVEKPKTQRPRQRLDDTAEEFEAMMVPFNKCLKKAGFTDQVQWKQASDRSDRGDTPSSEKQAQENAAYRACEQRYAPLPAWERDPANPEAADFARLVDKCLKKKGADKLPIARAMALSGDCEREAAAAFRQ